MVSRTFGTGEEEVEVPASRVEGERDVEGREEGKRGFWNWVIVRGNLEPSFVSRPCAGTGMACRRVQ